MSAGMRDKRQVNLSLLQENSKRREETGAKEIEAAGVHTTTQSHANVR